MGKINMGFSPVVHFSLMGRVFRSLYSRCSIPIAYKTPTPNSETASLR